MAIDKQLSVHFDWYSSNSQVLLTRSTPTLLWAA